MNADIAARLAIADTFPKLLRLNAREYGQDIALREKDLGIWDAWTWGRYCDRVRDLAQCCSPSVSCWCWACCCRWWCCGR
jgi:long-subunit acyl-CoA synthetase (AMP-forming)